MTLGVEEFRQYDSSCNYYKLQLLFYLLTVGVMGIMGIMGVMREMGVMGTMVVLGDI